MKKIRYGRVRLWVAVTVAMLWTATGRTAEKTDVERLLLQFEQNTSVETANRFMEALTKEVFLDEPIHFAAQTAADSLRQQVYYWAAEWLYAQQQYKQAEREALRALPLFHKANDCRADCLNLLGIIYVRLGDLRQAVGYAKQCLEMDTKSGNDDRISSSMNTVAGIYMAGYQAQEAEQYIMGALKHSERTNNPQRRAVILGMASEVYHSLGDEDKALTYAEQAYHIDSLLGREPQMSIRLSQRGAALLGLHRYTEAEDVYRHILPALKAAGDGHSYAIALNRLGTALLNLERQQEAIPYYKEAARLFSQMDDLYNEIHSYQGLYESYWEIEPDSAKTALDRYNLLKDSLYNHATAETLSRYNAEFGNEQLRQENAEVRQARQTAIITGVLLLLLVVAMAWIIIHHQHRRYQQKMHELVGEIEKLHADSEGTKTKTKTETDEEAETAEAETAEAEETDEGEDDEEVTSFEDRLFLMNVIEAANAAMTNGNLSVEQVAADMNLGVQSFRRRLQSAAGETPKAYITAIQMERAVSLLTERPDMPLSRIAQQCGFEDTSSFGHTFKRIYGCSPSQYRRQQ